MSFNGFSPPSSTNDFDNNVPPAILKVFGMFAGLVILLSLLQWCLKSDQSAEEQSASGAPRAPYGPSEDPGETPACTFPRPSAVTLFSFSDLAAATDKFSDRNLLGQGGFGCVHRGVLRDGMEVAVKQLKAGSVQGEAEFRAEVEIISRVHHRHLVSLVGYCVHHERRLLVYELVPNKTLEFHLHGHGQPRIPLSTRMKIALGSAKGLAYLHEDCSPKIIHRDIKAANILLDFNFEAKVADFGLAKMTHETETHVSTRIMGTRGYVAPEYVITGRLTEKSDMFSYGVMLLELITSRPPIIPSAAANDDPISLAEWARPLLTEALESNSYDSLVDPQLEQGYDADEMERLLVCAAACIRHSARKRPKMGQVVRVLEGGVSLEELNAGVNPGHSTPYSATRGSDDGARNHREDLKRFRQMVLESSQEEHASSDCTPSADGSGHIQSARSEVRPLLT